MLLAAFVEDTKSLTASEAAHRAIELGYEVSMHSYWKRVSDLLAEGWIKETGYRVKGERNRYVRKYEITSAGIKAWQG